MRFLFFLLLPLVLKAQSHQDLEFSSRLPARGVTDFSANWSFHLGDVPEAKSPDFDSSAWKTLTVPHDWAFENGVSKNGTQKANGGYYSGGIGWYRKTFTAPELTADQELHLHFDGVYMNSEVFLNGTSLGIFPYGYLSFSHELTPHLKEGKNTLAVRVNNSLEPSARWYHPCGIYAPVTLKTLPKKRIESVFVTTPVITADSATIKVAIQAPAGLTADHTLLTEASVKRIKTDSFTIPNPRLWSPENPNLYTLVTRLKEGNRIIDQITTTFGIRSIKWDPATGFHLNGKAFSSFCFVHQIIGVFYQGIGTYRFFSTRNGNTHAAAYT